MGFECLIFEEEKLCITFSFLLIDHDQLANERQFVQEIVIYFFSSIIIIVLKHGTDLILGLFFRLLSFVLCPMFLIQRTVYIINYLKLTE